MKRKAFLIIGATVAIATMAAAEVIAPGDVVFEDGGAVLQSLTGTPGDPVAGRDIFANRKLGNCLACHQNTDLNDQLFHGEVGPSLDGVADRWEEAQLRGILTNSKNTFEDTIMPAFYRTDGLSRVMEKFQGKTILTAQQVEDVLAYLLTLKE